MEIEAIKKLIQRSFINVSKRNSDMNIADLYYRNENDILRNKRVGDKNADDTDKETNPLRNADNRISHNWHQLLVDQKAAYGFTYPPQFDVDLANGKDNNETNTLNQEIITILGDKYPNIAKNLCKKASNFGISWLHVWIDEETKAFKYAIVDSRQIVPVWDKSLEQNLKGIFRTYEDIDDDGNVFNVTEYWNDTECSVYRTEKYVADDLDSLEEYNAIPVYFANTQVETNRFNHSFPGRIPFIPFPNNELKTGDLKKTKALIDVYDRVFSGFVNDVDDVQEIIFVLTNYGGEDKQKFINDLKQYKTIKVDSNGEDKSGVDTLAIDIPIEARNKILDITHNQIFVSGQGVDPQKELGNNNSGEALKYLYSLLELKAGDIETEFRLGFAKLIEFILVYLNKESLIGKVQIKQTWTRSSINNDKEQAEIVASLASVTSRENIAKANPIVDNWEDEIDLLDAEDDNADRMKNDYLNDEEVDIDGEEE